MLDLLIVALVVTSMALWLGRRWWRISRGQGAGCGCGCGEGGCGASGELPQTHTCCRPGGEALGKENKS
ncbi:MAG: FeoB-associated Cys-rich membrane protein [Pseudomonadota bacterium]